MAHARRYEDDMRIAYPFPLMGQQLLLAARVLRIQTVSEFFPESAPKERNLQHGLRADAGGCKSL